MPLKFVKGLKGMINDQTTAYGLMYNDWVVLSACQKECTAHLATAIQLEEEAYMTRHPEVITSFYILLNHFQFYETLLSYWHIWYRKRSFGRPPQGVLTTR